VFIDGLDEYKGRHDELIQTIVGLSKLPNIKFCVSSRPWNVFTQAFENDGPPRMITLEAWTRSDIELYARDRLERNPQLQALQLQDPRLQNFVDEVIEKARGVFLWVNLVINEILDSLTNADDWSTLQRRLRRMPPDLEPYFQHMFDTLDNFYTVESAQHFLVTLHAPYNVHVLGFSVLHSGDPTAVDLTKRLEHPGWNEAHALSHRLSRRIKAYCRDLVEIDMHATRVQFLHRTVLDFLSRKFTIEMLEQRACDGFDIDRVMCQQSTITMLLWLHVVGERNYDPHSVYATFFHHARNIEDRESHTPINLHDAFYDLTQRLEGECVSSFRELHSGPTMLALMHLPAELQRRLESREGKTPIPALEESLWAALGYCNPRLLHADPYDDVMRIMEASIVVDPERRGHRFETIDTILHHGAEVNRLFTGTWVGTAPKEHSVWERFLLLLQHDSTFKQPKQQHDIYFQICEILLKAGARTNRLPEIEILSEFFGPPRVQLLLSTRRTSKASASGWLPK
jgi:hypothetical protein